MRHSVRPSEVAAGFLLGLLLLVALGCGSGAERAETGSRRPAGPGGVAGPSAPSPGQAAAPAAVVGKTEAEVEKVWGSPRSSSETALKGGGTLRMKSYQPSGFGAATAGYLQRGGTAGAGGAVLVVAAVHLKRGLAAPADAFSAVGLNARDWEATGKGVQEPYVPQWRWEHKPAPSPEALAQVELRPDSTGRIIRVKLFTDEGIRTGAATPRAPGKSFPK